MPSPIMPNAMTSVWNWLGRRKSVPAEPPTSRFPVARVRRVFEECASGVGGEASARSRVAMLATVYRGLDDEGKRAYLTLLAEHRNGTRAMTP
ncbi:MAG TPA: hypothetical protein VLG08_11975, partial [Casimicrobiaceae bacterium]|nr:hypothetical protein [Casimicrobiaceae bacterium]